MIAIIPARAGSKGLPKKNTKPLNGLPLIGHTIVEASKSQHISDIIVSTDSREIADIAIKIGAQVPFLRPNELAQDNSKAIDVYIYTIDRLNNEFGYKIHNFIVLQPTSPLRSFSDIDAAIDKFQQYQADSIISVTEASHPPAWAKKIRKDETLEDYFPHKSSNRNRQEIEKAYMPNGAIFIFNASKLKAEYRYYFEKTYPFIMPAERSIDIDTELDFNIVEYLMEKGKI